jgi:hypothetical protein
MFGGFGIDDLVELYDLHRIYWYKEIARGNLEAIGSAKLQSSLALPSANG